MKGLMLVVPGMMVSVSFADQIQNASTVTTQQVDTTTGENKFGGSTVNLDSVMVTATRGSSVFNDGILNFDLPYFASTVTTEDIKDTYQFTTVPNALKYVPGVSIQATSSQQQSPYIRGFTGYRLMMAEEGVKVNNAIMREGANQYWGTIDPLTVDRMEVVKGTSSVLWGSDAIGGVVNILTKKRIDYGPGFNWDRNVYYRFGSADTSSIGRAEFTGQGDGLGFVLGTSIKSFNDVSDANATQPHTGYDSQNFDIRLDYRIDSNSNFTFGNYYYNSDNAWRTHSTIFGVPFEGTKSGSYLERFYDQGRFMSFMRYDSSGLEGIVNGFTATLSYQGISERQSRFKVITKKQRMGMNDDTIGLRLQAYSDTQFGRFTYGTEYYHDFVNSFERILENGVLETAVQGPVANNSSYDNLGVYLQNEYDFTSWMKSIIGVRYTNIQASTGLIVDDSSPQGYIQGINKNWNTAVASGRFLFRLDEAEHFNMFTGISQGFRAPTIFDLTGDELARSNDVQTPSPWLQPEHFVNYEIGFKSQFDDFSGEISYYYTDISDMIVRVPTGNIVDGAVEVQGQNIGNGFSQGIDLGVAYRIIDGLEAFLNFGWVDGKVTELNNGQQEFNVLSRLQPTQGSGGIHWSITDEAWVQIDTIMAHSQNRLNGRDRGDNERMPPLGTPGWAILNLRGGWEFYHNMKLNVAVENVTNKLYRVHGSGLNNPGVSGIVSVDIKF